ncbi:MAG TPA: hypothetical protein VLK65_01110 [Vicinamibacteria bacterium]|nr:hypothetical protein [Vicinamibacteria bacterium]
MHYPAWLWAVLALLLVLYFNIWMWDDAAIVLGFPKNLLYHVLLSLALSPLMLFVVRRAWPRFLDED